MWNKLLLRNYIDSDFLGSNFQYEKNLWSGNLENYITNLPEIFVRVRRSSDLVHATTRLNFLCLTTELGAREKKVTYLSTFRTHLKNI